jgi:predicted nucleic acid-binding protein
VIVLDCSALVHVLTDHGSIGSAIRQRIKATATTLHAPGLLDYELTSALLGMTRGGKITTKDAGKAISDYRNLALVRHETLLLWSRIRELHHNVSADDAHYVALAETLGIPLITSDARIKRSGAAKCEVEVFTARS